MDEETERLALKLGERIRLLRRKAGLSQVRFSEKTGLTQGYISRLETGRVELCIGSLRVICGALDTTISILFRGL
jgi:transcriptional regulator with XRE-family HTH domain